MYCLSPFRYITNWVAYKWQKVISHTGETGKFKIRATVDLVSVRTCLPDRYIFTINSHCRREELGLWGLSYEGTNLNHKGSSSDRILSQTPPSNVNHTEVGFPHMNLKGTQTFNLHVLLKHSVWTLLTVYNKHLSRRIATELSDMK